MTNRNEPRVSDVSGVDLVAAATKLVLNVGRDAGLTDEHIARLLRAAADGLAPAPGPSLGVNPRARKPKALRDVLTPGEAIGGEAPEA